MAKSAKQASPWLNVSIGFAGILCLILVVSLLIRIFSPRVENERTDDSFLIQNIIQVEVLNGAGASGIATRFTNTLRESGFDVVETGNFEHFNVKKSYVISRIDNSENARRIAQVLNIDKEQIIVLASNDFFLDATIVIGADWKDLNTD
jgi:hypothetical protein